MADMLCHHAKELLRIHLFCFPGQEIHTVIEAADTASLSQRFYHFICQVPTDILHGGSIGMTGHKRLLCMPVHIPETSVGKMRNIHDHSQTFHLLDHLDPKRRQAFFRPKFYAFSGLFTFGMHIRTAYLIGKIPGQCDHPHA